MKNYVVIGGTSGIGKALVNQLRENDNSVTATYFSTYPENNLDGVNYFQFNALTDTLDLEKFPNQIDGLAYCPGAIDLRPFQRFTEEDFVEDFRLQVMGATKVIRLLLPKLKASGAASIVLFSTIAVKMGFSFHTKVSISKGAIEGLTKALAAELAPKVRVNALAPSLADTPLAQKLISTKEKRDLQDLHNPMKRIGNPEEIAQLAAYLLSEKSSWITGQILPIDGGLSTLR